MIDHLPRVQGALFIAGFEGWGNALDVSRGMVDFLIRETNAVRFARLDPDPFYRYDENRPQTNVQHGVLTEVTPPAAVFHVASEKTGGRDLVLFQAPEPQLQWYRFCDVILSVCEMTGASSLVTIGSMFDDVLHTDTMVSAFASRPSILSELEAHRVVPVNYQGPSAIHTLFQEAAEKRGMDALSLWCHCPYYLQGTTHFGLLSHLASILGAWAGFEVNTSELDATWRHLTRQIQEIIEKNSELKNMINDLRKAKVKGSWDAARRHDNVIQLEDFLKPA
ncbi:MAG: PAC2 family protein [Desulfobacteraceae bacterium]|jgi:proteasome assembly chaperone (PAC2) family protein